MSDNDISGAKIELDITCYGMAALDNLFQKGERLCILIYKLVYATMIIPSDLRRNSLNQVSN